MRRTRSKEKVSLLDTEGMTRLLDAKVGKYRGQDQEKRESLRKEQERSKGFEATKDKPAFDPLHPIAI